MALDKKFFITLSFLIISFIPGFAKGKADVNTIPAKVMEKIQATEPTKKSYYICKVKNKKFAGDRLYGPLETEEQALVIWINNKYKSQKDVCIARDNHFRTRIPDVFYRKKFSRILDEFLNEGSEAVFDRYFFNVEYLNTQEESEEELKFEAEQAAKEEEERLKALEEEEKKNKKNKDKKETPAKEEKPEEAEEAQPESEASMSTEVVDQQLPPNNDQIDGPDKEDIVEEDIDDDKEIILDEKSLTDESLKNSKIAKAAEEVLPPPPENNQEVNEAELTEETASEEETIEPPAEVEEPDQTPEENPEPAVTAEQTNLEKEQPEILKENKEESTQTPPKTVLEEEKTPEPIFDINSEKDDFKVTKRYTKEYLQDYAPSKKPKLPVDEDEEQKLIEEPDAADGYGRTLLMKACQKGNYKEVVLLLKSGAKVNLTDCDGWTALMYAVRYQESTEIIDELLNAGAEVKAKNDHAISSLMLASTYSRNPEILKIILSNYAITDTEVLKAFVSLLSDNSVSENIRLTKINLYLDEGLNLNLYYNGKTPLMYAARYGNSTKVIKLLLQNSAQTDIRSNEGKTAFDYATQNKALPKDDIYWKLNNK